jgi:large subunit ribosomal protein L37Ae
MAKNNTGSTKRFGTRYGKTTKDKFGAIEAQQKKKYTCPHCSRDQVRRLSTGIWVCHKCGAKMASKAYTVTKQSAIQTKVLEM